MPKPVVMANGKLVYFPDDWTDTQIAAEIELFDPREFAPDRSMGQAVTDPAMGFGGTALDIAGDVADVSRPDAAPTMAPQGSLRQRVELMARELPVVGRVLSGVARGREVGENTTAALLDVAPAARKFMGLDAVDRALGVDGVNEGFQDAAGDLRAGQLQRRDEENARRAAEGLPSLEDETKGTFTNAVAGQLRERADAARDFQSDETKADKAAISGAFDRDIGEGLATLATSPADAANAFGPELATYLFGGAVIGRGARALGMADDAAAMLSAQAQGQAAAGGNAMGAKDAVLQLPEEKLLGTPMAQQLLAEDRSPAEIREIMAQRAYDAALGFSSAANAGLMTVNTLGGLNPVDNALAGALNKGPAKGLLSKIDDAAATAGGLSGRAARSVNSGVREFAGETLEGGTDQFSQNLGEVGGGVRKPGDVLENVGSSGILEGALGGTVGGISGGLTAQRAAAEVTARPTDPVDPAGQAAEDVAQIYAAAKGGTFDADPTPPAPPPGAVPLMSDPAPAQATESTPAPTATVPGSPAAAPVAPSAPASAGVSTELVPGQDPLEALAGVEPVIREGAAPREREAYAAFVAERTAPKPMPQSRAPGAPVQSRPVYEDPDVANKPDFGMPAPPRTLPDESPLLRPHWDPDKPELQDNSPERVAMRERLIEQRLAGKPPAPAGERPVAIFMGGGGASGKGTVLRAAGPSFGVDKESMVHLDPDSFKTGDEEAGLEGIPEYGQIKDAGDLRGAGVVHEESSYLYRQALTRATAARQNLILDRTLSDPAKAVKEVKELVDAGYDVRIVGVTVDPREAVIRSVRRSTGKDARYVPLGALLKAHKGFTTSFAALADVATEIRLYDNNVEKNGKPVLVAAGGKGQPLEIVNRTLYNNFVKKADINANATTYKEIGYAPEASTEAAAQDDAGRPAQALRDGRLEEGSRGPREEAGDTPEAGTQAREVSEGGPAPLSSRAEADPAPAKRAAIDRAIDALLSKLGIDRGKVVVLRKFTDLPDGVPRRGLDGRTEGIYHEGTVYLFTDALADPARAIWVTMHEFAGHLGLRALLPQDQLDKMLEQAGTNLTIRGVARAMQAEAKEEAEAGAEGARELPLSGFIEEALAEMTAAVFTGDFDALIERYGDGIAAERADAAAAESAAAEAKKAMSIAKRLGAAVKKFLYNEGVTMSDADVAALLRNAYKAAQSATPATGGGVAQSRPLVGDRTDVSKLPDGAGASAEVFTMAQAVDLAKSRKWAKGRDLKLAMQEEARSRQDGAGVDLREMNKTSFRILVDAVVSEAKEAIKIHTNAIGWYDKKVSQALAAISLVYPEMAKYKANRVAFIWALAVTSNGQKVKKNFELASDVYSRWKRDGVMPTDIKAGNAQGAINSGLELFNDLSKRMTPEQIETFLVTKFTVGEIAKSIGTKPGGEAIDTPVRGAAIAGPKVGNGFLSNLLGHFDQLTVDRWFMRTWGRMTGNLVAVDQAAVAARRRQLAIAVNSMTAGQRAEMRELVGDLSRATNEEVDDLAARIQKATADKAKREAMQASAKTDEMRKAGNGLMGALDGSIEAPSGPEQREWIRAVFGEALETLQKERPDLTMADLQAVLWYPEKKLYDTAKTKDDQQGEDVYADDEAPDYANVARDMAVAAGIPLADVEAAMRDYESSADNAPKEMTPAEKARFLKTVTAPPEQMQQFVFEVAPDPADAETMELWGQLPPKAKEKLTKEIGAETAAALADAMGLSGVAKPVTASGGYGGQINPNQIAAFPVTKVSLPEAKAFAAAVGLALDQASVVLVDARLGESNEAIRVVTPKGSKASPESIWAAITAGVPELAGEGFTARGNALEFLHWTGIPSAELSSRVQYLLEDAGIEAAVSFGDIKSTLVERKSYDSEIEALRPGLREVLDSAIADLRARTKQRFAEAVQAEAGAGPAARNRAGAARRGSGGGPEADAVAQPQSRAPGSPNRALFEELRGTPYGAGESGGDKQMKVTYRNGERVGRFSLVDQYDDGDVLYLTDLATMFRTKGGGGAALAEALGLADKHGVTLRLEAEPFGDSPLLSKDQLTAWYNRNGFERVGSTETLERKPKPAPMQSRAPNPQTETAEFKAWFGNSVIVNEDGTPRVVYHGTRGDFEVFAESRKDVGIHVGTAAQASNGRFTGGKVRGARGDAAKVLPLYASIQNPIRLPDIFGVVDEMIQGAWEYDAISLDERDQLYAQRDRAKSMGHSYASVYRMFEQMLKDKGFDGIVYENAGERDLVVSEDGKSSFADSYIALDPSQLKSATGNSGAFGAANPSIMQSRATTQAARARAAALRQQKSQLARELTSQFVTATQVKAWLGRARILIGEVSVSPEFAQELAEARRMLTPERRDALSGDRAALKRYDEIRDMMAGIDANQKIVRAKAAEANRLLDKAERRTASMSLADREALVEQLSESLEAAEEAYIAAKRIADWRAGNDGKVIKAHQKRNDTLGFLAAQGYQQGSFLWNGAGPLKDQAESKRRAIRRHMQDKMIDLRDVQEEIERQLGRSLDDLQNVYRAENQMHGKVANGIDAFRQRMVDPLKAAIKASGLSIPEVEKYLWAKHATERNAKIRAINPGVDDGSGMTDADAAAQLASYAPEQLAKLEAIGHRVNAIRLHTLETLVNAGQLDRAQADAIINSYTYYVPLRAKNEGEERIGGTGQGISASGSGIQRALGRKTPPKNILAELIGDGERAIVQSGKAEVGRALLRLVLSYPNPELWSVEPVVLEPKFNEATGEVYLAIGKVDDAESVVVKHNGKPYRVQIKHPRLVAALRNTGTEGAEWIVKYIGKLNRWLSAVFTRFNPGFVPVNLMRDLLQGVTGVAAELGAGSTGAVLNNYLPAMRATYLDSRSQRGDASVADADKTMADWTREFAEAGGKTGWTAIDDMDTLQADIENATMSIMAVAKTRPLDAIGEAFSRNIVIQTIEHANDAVENALRVATYAHLRKDKGWSKAKAADYAKEMTVNFNRKGASGSVINALYLFYNAGIQGSRRTLMLMRHPKVQAVLGSLMAGQAMLAMTIGMIKADDDDEMTLWEQIPDHVKRRSFVIPLGFDEQGNPRWVSIPMPFGFNIFPALGGYAANYGSDSWRGKQENHVASAVGYMSSVVIDAMSPVAVGEEGGMWPTVVGMGMDLARNRDDLGRRIGQSEDFTTYETPRAAMAKPGTPAPFVIAANLLNRIGGGDDYHKPTILPGLLDVSANDLEFLFNQFAGGPGTTITSFYRAAVREAGTGDAKAFELPVVRAVVGGARVESVEARRFYDNKDRIERNLDRLKDGFVEGGAARFEEIQSDLGPAYADIELKLRKTTTKHGAAGEVMADSGTGRPELVAPDGSALDTYRDADRALKAISSEMRRVFNDQSLTGVERSQQLVELQRQRAEAAKALNRLMSKADAAGG